MPERIFKSDNSSQKPHTYIKWIVIFFLALKKVCLGKSLDLNVNELHNRDHLNKILTD